MQWIFALLLALMLALPVSVVATGGEDDNDKSDTHDDDDDDERNREKDERREEGHGEHKRHEVDISHDDDEIKVELKRESNGFESEIEFKLQLDESKFRLKYSEESGQLETEQKISVELRSLVEYRDADGDGKYSQGDDIVSSWAFSSSNPLHDGNDDDKVNWGTPAVSDITVDGTDGKVVTATASMGESNGTFTIKMYVFGDFTDMDGVSLKPTDVKIDFIINDYDYQTNDTALAVLLRSKAKQETEQNIDDLDEGEEGLQAVSNTPSGTMVGLEFSWKGNATVDGVNTTVGTTLFKAETQESDDEFEHKQDFALSYSRGQSIIHDPTAGVTYEDQTSTSPNNTDKGLFGLPGFTSVVGLTALLGAALLLKRD
jgi:hypothetical protein